MDPSVFYVEKKLPHGWLFRNRETNQTQFLYNQELEERGYTSRGGPDLRPKRESLSSQRPIMVPSMRRPSRDGLYSRSCP